MDHEGTAWRRRLSELIREQARPIEKFGHQPRLYALTQAVGAGLSYDDDIVYAAVWLHDLGVFVGHRPEDPEALAAWDSVGYAVKQAPGILLELGFPEDRIEAVLDCIRNHQPQNDPFTVEATVLRDADILEQLGAIGILRTVSKVGRDTRFHTFSDAVTSLQKACDQLPSKLRLARARVLAEQRISVLRAFLAAVTLEAEENLF